jgi:hypothetical protein
MLGEESDNELPRVLKNHQRLRFIIWELSHNLNRLTPEPPICARTFCAASVFGRLRNLTHLLSSFAASPTALVINTLLQMFLFRQKKFP